MSTIRITIYPWLTSTLGVESPNPTLLEEESGESQTVKDLLNRLVAKYPRFVEAVFDFKSQRLTGQATVIFNGCLLELVNGLETRISGGDALIFMPPWEGG